MTPTLYDNIVEVVRDYLGPAGQRLVDRQITNHLNKDPQSITGEDLERINEWMKVSLSLLTDNRQTIDECTQRIAQLA